MDVTRRVGRVHLREIPIRALGETVRRQLSSMLNEHKLTRSPTDLYRDYRGLAQLMNVRVHSVWSRHGGDSMACILEMRSRHSLADLQRFFEQIDRFDVLDDTYAQFVEDAIAWLNPRNEIVRSFVSLNVLTEDDLLQPESKYDAFLLYDDSDAQFAIEVYRTLQSAPNSLKICVKDFLLGGIRFEHEAVIRLISERCNRLIVILSDEFLRSSKNRFHLNFAQSHGLAENNERFVVPVTYKDCALPAEYRMYVLLDRRRNSVFYTFWGKLRSAVCTNA